MNPAYSIIARKYAMAFMQTVGGSFGEQDLRKTIAIKKFLRKNRSILFFLNMPLFDKKLIDATLDTLLHGLSTRKMLERLMVIIIKQRRAAMLPDVLHHIADLYSIKSGTMHFTIKSSHELSQESLQAAGQFLEEKTGDRIMYDHHVDQNLIAGIRMMSSNLLWEYSVQQQVKRLMRTVTD